MRKRGNVGSVYETSELEEAEILIRAIKEGIRHAGGNPKFDLRRMVDLADQIGALIMDNIFHTEHTYTSGILGQNNAALALNEAGWTIDANSYGGIWLWDAFTSSLDTPDLEFSPKKRLFELVSPQRNIRGQEMLAFFENGKLGTCHPNMAAELVLGGEMNDQGWIACPWPRDIKVGVAVSMSLNPTSKQYSLHPFFRVNFPKGYPI